MNMATVTIKPTGSEHSYIEVNGVWVATVLNKYAEAVRVAVDAVANRTHDQRESAVIREGTLQDEQANGNGVQSQTDSRHIHD